MIKGLIFQTNGDKALNLGQKSIKVVDQHLVMFHKTISSSDRFFLREYSTIMVFALSKRDCSIGINAFKPNNLVTSLYKVLEKALFKHLSIRLPKNISSSQRLFVKDVIDTKIIDKI